MARVQTQGHQNFQQRFERVRSETGMMATEICAESWSWEKDADPKVVGQSMFKAWRQSPGHWSVASKKHRAFGAGIACGRNGIWYATILAGN
jgi:hypothetical protein